MMILSKLKLGVGKRHRVNTNTPLLRKVGVWDLIVLPK